MSSLVEQGMFLKCTSFAFNIVFQVENLDVLKNKTSKEVTDLKAELKKRDAQVRKI